MKVGTEDRWVFNVKLDPRDKEAKGTSQEYILHGNCQPFREEGTKDSSTIVCAKSSALLPIFSRATSGHDVDEQLTI